MRRCKEGFVNCALWIYQNVSWRNSYYYHKSIVINSCSLRITIVIIKNANIDEITTQMILQQIKLQLYLCVLFVTLDGCFDGNSFARSLFGKLSLN